MCRPRLSDSVLAWGGKSIEYSSNIQVFFQQPVSFIGEVCKRTSQKFNLGSLFPLNCRCYQIAYRRRVNRRLNSKQLCCNVLEKKFKKKPQTNTTTVESPYHIRAKVFEIIHKEKRSVPLNENIGMRLSSSALNFCTPEHIYLFALTAGQMSA